MQISLHTGNDTPPHAVIVPSDDSEADMLTKMFEQGEIIAVKFVLSPAETYRFRKPGYTPEQIDVVEQFVEENS